MVRRIRTPAPLIDDGDALNFCGEMHVLVEHTGPYEEGRHVFREGDEFNAIAAVRSGTIKTCVTDLEGREQVLGFYLPGEVIGLSAICRLRYPYWPARRLSTWGTTRSRGSS